MGRDDYSDHVFENGETVSMHGANGVYRVVDLTHEHYIVRLTKPHFWARQKTIKVKGQYMTPVNVSEA